MRPIRPTWNLTEIPRIYRTCHMYIWYIQSNINHATYHISICHLSCHEGILARYIGNSSRVSCNLAYLVTLVLRHTGNHLEITQERTSATVTCILDLCHTSYLDFTMSYFYTCSTDARATTVTSLHDLPAGDPHGVVTHTFNPDIHVRKSRKANSHLIYI